MAKPDTPRDYGYHGSRTQISSNVSILISNIEILVSEILKRQAIQDEDRRVGTDSRKTAAQKFSQGGQDIHGSEEGATNGRRR